MGLELLYIAAAELTSLDRLGKAFIIAQTSHFKTLFRAGVTGVSVKHRHVSLCWKKLLMILA